MAIYRLFASLLHDIQNNFHCGGFSLDLFLAEVSFLKGTQGEGGSGSIGAKVAIEKQPSNKQIKKRAPGKQTKKGCK